MFELINMEAIKCGDNLTLFNEEMKTVKYCEHRDEYVNVAYDEYATINYYEIGYTDGSSYLYNDAGCVVNHRNDDKVIGCGVVKIGAMEEQEWVDWEEAFNAS